MNDQTSRDRAAALLDLHKGPGFVIPNAWDAGSARILERIGFPAVATTSAGIAWSCGVPDGGTLDGEQMLARVAEIVSAVDIPVSADLESGYAATPDGVAETIARAVKLGVVGANLEDTTGGVLFDVDDATARIAAARAVAPKGTFVLNARTDAYFHGSAGDPYDETIARAQRYLDAGADCIFVPGVDDADEIQRLAAAIQAPLNIVAGLTPTVIDVPTLFSLGVVRISLGGGLARTALGALDRAARELSESGTLGFFDGAIRSADIQRQMGA